MELFSVRAIVAIHALHATQFNRYQHYLYGSSTRIATKLARFINYKLFMFVFCAV